eukprot:1154470-Pelagomonas_calceolata.AAC.3
MLNRNGGSHQLNPGPYHALLKADRRDWQPFPENGGVCVYTPSREANNMFKVDEGVMYYTKGAKNT